MNDRPEKERRDQDADTHDTADDASNDTRILPKVDPRQQDDHERDALPEAPPIDIDDRDTGVSHAEPPDLIELPDHPDERDLLERPLDHEFEPLPFDGDADARPSSLPSPEAGAGNARPGSEPDPAAEDEQWVPPDAAASETAYDPEFEPATTATIPPSVTDEAPAAGVASNADNATAPSGMGDQQDRADRKSNGASESPSRGAGFLGSLGSAARSARSTVTAKAAALSDSTETGSDADDDGGFAGMFRSKSGDLLDPSLHAVTTLPHRMVLIGGAIVILLSLLSNNAGLALIVASAIVPVWIALTLNQQDVFEKESALLTTAVGAAGLVIGVIFSSLSSWLVNSNWFDNGVLNYGAAGFGGRYADLAGSAPLVVWFLCGLLLPLLGLGAIVAVPIAMRRWPQFRNEVMDGVILSGTSAAGFAIGSAVVFWAPMVSDEGPQTSVSDWTLTAIGVVLLRPIVITLAGAMLGAGVWKYMLTPTPGVVILPALGSIGGILLLSFGSLQFQPSGLWPELVWTLLIAIASFLIYHLVLNSAISSDRKVVGEDQARVVCPNCRKITPAGAFCAHCGAVLERDPVPAAV